ncbi:hypothetical protein LTR09_010165 [Extremus antarcticus]|uniref:Uncharacterized protein n=1 Tax=Extremus antarcticus TaxID=702011 RepID=A0AAJ0DE59_9PEZI|nr:hypothetical protein LTR09_010165 [Extremus antarcticus]
MAPEKPVATASGAGEADLATAFQELAKGERTATALETQLNNMEAKIEALLAQAENDQQEVQRLKDATAGAEQGEVKKEGA